VNLLGVKDIVSKSLGASNPLNVARVTVKALLMLKAPREKKTNNQQPTTNNQNTEKAAV